jgi:hypothetical protein
MDRQINWLQAYKGATSLLIIKVESMNGVDTVKPKDRSSPIFINVEVGRETCSDIQISPPRLFPNSLVGVRADV